MIGHLGHLGSIFLPTADPLSSDRSLRVVDRSPVPSPHGDRSEGPVTAGHILGYHCEPFASSILGLFGPGSERILQCHLKLHARRGATILFRRDVEAPPMVSRLSLSFSVFGARAVVFTGGGFGSFLRLFIIRLKSC